jgi:hypothetical protein
MRTMKNAKLAEQENTDTRTLAFIDFSAQLHKQCLDIDLLY